MSRRAVAYIRCSSNGQEFESQRDLIRRFAAREDFDVVEWYKDIGTRDESEKRQDFQRLLKDVESRVVTNILVETKKRFGTKGNSNEFSHFAFVLQKNGVNLWSAMPGEGLLTASDIKTKIINAVDDEQSEKELLDKAERLIKGKLQTVKDGRNVGGYVPYGYDVLCLDKEGKEKYRVVMEGRLRRIKIDPDGTQTVYEGVKNFPGRDKTDRTVLAPSIRPERIEAIKALFDRYSKEKISFHQLAKWLIATYPPSYGEVWFGAAVANILRNPVYRGVPTWNKFRNGKKLQWKDGELKPVPYEFLKRQRGWKDKADRIEGEYREDLQLVDDATFDAVQEKLGSPKEARKSSVKAELWLRPFLHCSTCGKPMRSWTTKAHGSSYQCQTYDKYLGNANPCGCGKNRILADKIDAIVEGFLGTFKGNPLKPMTSPLLALAGEVIGAGADVKKIYSQISKMYQGDGSDNLETPILPELDEKTLIFFALNTDTLFDYAPFAWLKHDSDEQRKENEDKLSDLSAKMVRLLENFNELTNPIARDFQQKEIDKVGKEIERLQKSAEPIEAKFKKVLVRFLELNAALSTAINERKNSADRERSEALGKIVRKIVLHFIPNPDRGKWQQSNDLLVKVEFVLVDGSVKTVEADKYPTKQAEKTKKA